MATIAENIQTLRSIKSDIKNAILQKGGVVTDAFGGYAQAITDLPSGGGGGTEIEDALVMKTISGTYYNNRVSKVGSFAFCSTTLQSVNFPNCISVGNNAFAYCYFLSSIYLPKCSSIGQYVFDYCYDLVSINLPNCLYVGSGAFMNTHLTYINLPLCTSVGENAFNDCDFTSVNLPLCSYLGNSAFQRCSVLKFVNLPNCSTVGYYAFASCYSLKSIDLPNCISISTNPFAYCSKLSIVKLPIIKTLNSYVFSYCSTIKQLYINGGSQLVSLASYASSIFKSLSLAVIYVPSSLYSNYVHSSYSYWGRMSSFFATYTSSIQSIYLSLQNGTSSVIELNTTFMPQISWLMENYNTNPITMIDAPNCESIMNEAFKSLSHVTSVSLPNCRYIGDFGMRYMTNLTEINLPNLEYTSNSPFAYCSAVSIIKIPICKSLGPYAFSYCSNLKEVYLNSVTSVTSINNYTLNNCPNLTSVYVPSSLVDAFKTARYWSSISDKIVAYTEP